MSFKDLKKKSSLGTLTAKLVKEAEKMNNSYADDAEKLWKLECDKAQNGYAVIRFLPAPEGEDLPWVKMWTHFFQGKYGWYAENCRTTLGRHEKDPCAELNTELWAYGKGSPEQAQAQKQKRKLSYYSNIYVVKDPANPQNEGKVFLFKYGKSIYDLVMASMTATYEDETAIDPFDFWKGANFKLKARNKEGYRNYELSTFAAPEVFLDGDDDAMEAVWKQCHPLAAIAAPDQFKPYDVLKKNLDRVLGLDRQVERSAPQEDIEDDTETVMAIEEEILQAPTVSKRQPSPTPPSSSELDADLAWFEHLND